MQSRGAFSIRVLLWALSGASPKTLIAGCATPISSRASARRFVAAHSNMSEKVRNVSSIYSVWEGGAGRMRGKLRKEVVQW